MKTGRNSKPPGPRARLCLSPRFRRIAQIKMAVRHVVLTARMHYRKGPLPASFCLSLHGSREFNYSLFPAAHDRRIRRHCSLSDVADCGALVGADRAVLCDDVGECFTGVADLL